MGDALWGGELRKYKYYEDRDEKYRSQRFKQCDMGNKETREWGESYPKWKKHEKTI